MLLFCRVSCYLYSYLEIFIILYLPQFCNSHVVAMKCFNQIKNIRTVRFSKIIILALYQKRLLFFTGLKLRFRRTLMSGSEAEGINVQVVYLGLKGRYELGRDVVTELGPSAPVLS